MTLNYLDTNDVIQITSQTLTDHFNAPATFDIELVFTLNNEVTNTIQFTGSDAIGFDTAEPIYTDGADFFITPGAFNLEEFTDGIYHVSLKKITSSVSFENMCLFIDKTVSGKMCDYLDSSEIDISNKMLVSVSYIALENVSSCACNCDEAVTIFNDLIYRLDNLKCRTC